MNILRPAHRSSRFGDENLPVRDAVFLCVRKQFFPQFFDEKHRPCFAL